MPLGSRGKDAFAIYLLIGLLIAFTLAASVTSYRAAVEARWNREVLCIGILGNSANNASSDPRVIELCSSVGVREGR